MRQNSTFVEKDSSKSFLKIKIIRKLQIIVISIARVGSLVVSDLRSETKRSRLESGCYLCALSSAIAWLMSKCFWSGWKCSWEVSEMLSPPPSPSHPLQFCDSWMIMKETQIEKKNTGKYRGAAYNICNLEFNVRNEIPAVFHNSSNYYCDFIIKELSKKFEGQFECIRENILSN